MKTNQTKKVYNHRYIQRFNRAKQSSNVLWRKLNATLLRCSNVGWRVGSIGSRVQIRTEVFPMISLLLDYLHLIGRAIFDIHIFKIYVSTSFQLLFCILLCNISKILQLCKRFHYQNLPSLLPILNINLTTHMPFICHLFLPNYCCYLLSGILCKFTIFCANLHKFHFNICHLSYSSPKTKIV